jgi:hypothetical protein
MSKKNLVCIHNRLLFHHKKGQMPVICGNMDRSGDHNVKWSKPDTERHDFTRVELKKKTEFMEIAK